MKHAATRLCFWGISLVPALALAEPSAAEKTMATQLFDDAEKLLGSGRAGDACPKYAESQKLDPQLGTLLHLADCYEKIGKTASAWSSFREATELAAKRGDPREATARARTAALQPKLSKITLTVADGASAEIEIRQDGDLVRRAVWGSGVPVDPGVHRITAAAPGYDPWETKIEVTTAGSHSVVKVPLLALHPKSEPASNVPAAVPVPPRDAAKAPSGADRSMVGLWVGGAGVAAIGVGLGFGVWAKSQYDGADCPDNKCRTEADGAARDAASTKALVATVVFGVGAAALVGGGIMWFTASGTSERAAGSQDRLRVGIAPGAVVLRGSF